MIRPRLMTLLASLVLMVLALGGAAAQTPAPQLTPEVERLAKAARADGATVIVMTPAAPTPMPAMMDTMRAERFLAARARLSEIFASAATLPEAMALTIARIDALGRLSGDPFDLWWLLRGLGTALLGGFVGWLAIRPVVRIVGRSARRRGAAGFAIRTTADRAFLLLRKTAIALLFAVSIYLVALVVAVVLDGGFEPTRRVIFEALTAFLVYRLLRFGFAWPVTSYDFPEHRLVGLDDEGARRLFRSFVLWTAATLVPITGLRFFVAEGLRASEGGQPYGALTDEHVALVVILMAAIGTFAVTVFALMNRRGVRALLAPRDAPDPDTRPSAWHRVRVGFAAASPFLIVAYGVFALGAFLLRLGSGQPAPAVTIVAPFAIGYVAFVVYGLALVTIQSVYDTRERRYRARIARERETALLAAQDDRAQLAEGEEMVARSAAETDMGAPVEFRPVLRAFLEQAALAIILVVALGELGRWWGVPVGEDGNAWAGFLDIILAVALAWIAYRAITAAIDHRLAEEAGPEMDEDSLGNEGGAGASRLATLLPILRWVLVAVVLVAAVIAILSRFGVDIGPLLASAGVVGIAVGFGAQKLIQDVFSGAFFLLDDAFRRGEYIEVEGTKGTVERISIRSFQLRHHLGALHTLPFGEIRQLTNYSRDWVLMKLPLRVTYDTDVERVRKLIKKLGQELLEHPEVGHTFMQPLKSQGVYKMEDSAMIIRVKFMTKPGEQFVTRKVVYAAIQELFAREGIRFAHKEVTVRLADGDAAGLSEDQRNAVTAAAREVIDAEEAAAGAAAGR